MGGLIKVFLGALLNRIRGGLRIFGKKLPLNKIWFPLYIGALIAVATDGGFKGFITGFLASYIGQQICGWGKAAGAATTGIINNPDEKECEMIDDLLDNLKITIKGHTIYVKESYPVLWALLWLALRGLVWTFLIGLSLQSVNYMLCGAAMGIIYCTTGYICREFFHKMDKTAWNISEWIYGGWMTFCLLLV